MPIPAGSAGMNGRDVSGGCCVGCGGIEDLSSSARQVEKAGSFHPSGRAAKELLGSVTYVGFCANGSLRGEHVLRDVKISVFPLLSSRGIFLVFQCWVLLVDPSPTRRNQ